jgi:hypothetical protein
MSLVDEKSLNYKYFVMPEDNFRPHSLTSLPVFHVEEGKKN